MGPAPLSLGVLVIGEDPLARSAVRAALSDALTVLATAARVSELPPTVDDAQAIVWDLGLAPDRALEEAADVLARNAPVVALAPDSDAAQSALAAGVQGVVARDADGPLIAAAIRAVAAGLAVTDPRLAPDIPKPRHNGAEPDALTHREREVLALVVEGLSNRAIAQRLGISEHTAKFHVNQLLQKLGAQTRTEAVVKAARLGWVTL